MNEMDSGEFGSKPDKPKSFLDFLGSRRRENVEELVGRVMDLEDDGELREALQTDGLGPEEIDELRSVLGGRQRRGEPDALFKARSLAADRLITVRGKMAWQPGESPPDEPKFRRDSLSAGYARTPRPEKRRYPETESGDE